MATTLTVGVEIGAPAALVWRLLSDFAGYPRWNRFTPRVTCSGIVGEPVTLLAQLKERGAPREVHLILHDWVAGEQICWGDASWTLQVERCQRVIAMSRERSRYESSERFAGPLAPLVILTQQQRLIRGYRWVAEGLKKEAESMFRSANR